MKSGALTAAQSSPTPQITSPGGLVNLTIPRLPVKFKEVFELSVYVEQMTENERITLKNAMCAPIVSLERANMLLDTVLEDSFYEAKQESISAGHAEWIGDMLKISCEIVDDVLMSYYLLVANEEKAARYLKEADMVGKAVSCGRMTARLRNLERGMNPEKREEVTEARKKICDMDDSIALSLLTGLAEGQA